MSGYYAIFLKIEGQRCVVVGGGEVAGRKVRTLLDSRALPVVVSPSVSEELRRLAAEGKVQVLQRDYRDTDLDGARLAIAAADDPEVNRQVAEQGRRRGVLVNVVDSAELSDFILPSLVQRGDLTVAVSTAGKSPALARRLREAIEEGLGQEYGELASLLGEVRAELRRRGTRVPPDAWHESLDLETLLRRLRQGERDAVRRELVSSLAGEKG